MDKACPPQRNSLRAIALGGLLIPLNQFWLMRAETIYPATFSTLLTIFYNVTFTLFVLVVANAGVRRVVPRVAFAPRELLIVYVMLSVGTGVFGHDLLLVLVQSLAGTAWFPTPENDWENLFVQYLPSWMRIERGPGRGYFLGGSSFHTWDHVLAWFRPVLFWSAFLVVLLYVTLLLAALVRRQWTENEKLAYPIVQLPLELATDTRLLQNRRMWVGFGVAGILDVLGGLHAYVPAIPWPALTIDFGALVSTKPWTAAHPLIAWVYPFVIGLGYFLPLSLSFSIWTFYLVWKVDLVARSALGIWETPGPFRSHQTAGSWLVLTVLVFWASRRHLASVLRSAVVGRRDVDEREPMAYRTVLIGLVVGFAVLVALLAASGLPVWVGASFLALYLVYMVAIMRMRAESGPPAHDAHRMGPDVLLLNVFSTRTLGATTIAKFSGLYWMSRSYRSVPAGHQLEGFKLAEAARGSGRPFVVAMIVASGVATLGGFWVFLQAMYAYGAANVQHQIGSEPFRHLESWILYPMQRDFGQMREMGIGAVVTVVLMVLHRRYVGFPLHPIGYAVACGSVMEKRAWFSILIAWAIKKVVLTAGGTTLYRRWIPFFVGLILGQQVIGSLWNIFGITHGEVVYRFFR